MPNSGIVASGQEATAEQYNNLRKDVLDATTGHKHDGTDGKKLDWDECWTDAVHSHATNAEGGQIDHGAACVAASLLDDDHTQYQLKSLLTTQGDMVYATAASTWVRLAKGTALQNLRMNAGATAPEWATASGLTGSVALKTADETVNNSTTLQNDDHLVLAAAANEIWHIFLLLRITTAAAADFKFAFTLPAAGAMRGAISGSSAVGFFELTSTESYTTSVDATASTAVVSAGPKTDAWWLGWFVYVGGANAGNVQLQWAQLAADASDTKVLTNSFILAHKLA